jgi:hypothetical protein
MPSTVVDERLLPEGELEGLVLRRTASDAPRPVEVRRLFPGDEPPGELDGVDDLDVAGAPAQVPGECLGDLGARRRGVLLEQVASLHDDARRAEPALRRARRGKRERERLSLVVVEALEREDRFAGELGRRLGARDARVAVHDHRAAAAVALGLATVLRREKAEMLPEDVEQRLVLGGFDGRGRAVDGELDSVGHCVTPCAASAGGTAA